MKALLTKLFFLKAILFIFIILFGSKVNAQLYLGLNRSALKNILVNIPIIEKNQGGFTTYEFTLGPNIIYCHFKNDVSDRVLLQVIAPQTKGEELKHLKYIESNYIKIAEGFFYKPASGDQKEINVSVSVNAASASGSLLFDYFYDEQ